MTKLNQKTQTKCKILLDLAVIKKTAMFDPVLTRNKIKRQRKCKILLDLAFNPALRLNKIKAQTKCKILPDLAIIKKTPLFDPALYLNKISSKNMQKQMYIEIRTNLNSIIKSVVELHEPLIITSKNEDVILISKKDYDNMQVATLLILEKESNKGISKNTR